MIEKPVQQAIHSNNIAFDNAEIDWFDWYGRVGGWRCGPCDMLMVDCQCDDVPYRFDHGGRDEVERG